MKADEDFLRILDELRKHLEDKKEVERLEGMYRDVAALLERRGATNYEVILVVMRMLADVLSTCWRKSVRVCRLGEIPSKEATEAMGVFLDVAKMLLGFIAASTYITVARALYRELGIKGDESTLWGLLRANTRKDVGYVV